MACGRSATEARFWIRQATNNRTRNARADFLEIAGCEGMVPGGRVELPTPAFSGPRSTGELPRHRGDTHSTGAAENSQNGDSAVCRARIRNGCDAVVSGRAPLAAV
jgi:hypothetical protein